MVEPAPGQEADISAAAFFHYPSRFDGVKELVRVFLHGFGWQISSSWFHIETKFDRSSRNSVNIPQNRLDFLLRSEPGVICG